MDVDIVIEELYMRIDKLRDNLNELCFTLDEDENCEEKLNLSQSLDVLIVEYMNRNINNHYIIG